MADGDVAVERAPAKLNLALHVGPVDPDGYHPVRTLMVELDGLHDTVTVRRSAARRVDCPGLDGPANLAWRALDALEARTGVPLPLHVVIDKRIPSPAGLGGGSSDAAATLRAARRLAGLDVGDADLEAVAASVGSDAAFFVRGGTRWATGRGDLLAPAPPVDFWAVVTRPVPGLATGRVYAAFDRVARPGPVDGPPPDVTRWWDAPAAANDLWPAALATAPALGRVARALAAAGARRVLLCGSGGAMAGLWRDEAGARAGAEALGTAALAVTRPARPGPQAVFAGN